MSETAELTSFTGKVTYIVYRNDATFYTVLRIRLNDTQEKNITATGIIPEVEPDILYRFTGQYGEHPRYGMQFQISSVERLLPEEREGVIRYLSGVQFTGIGRKTAEKIVDLLGENCLQLIREDDQILYTVPGLSADKARVIYEGIQGEEDGMSELVRFLNVHGVGIRNLIRLNRAYGKEALSKLKENPYRVIEECDGFGFKTADAMAMSLGFARDDERRLYALLISLCMDLCVARGDSWTDVDVLAGRFRKETPDIEADFDALLQETLLHHQLVREENRIYPVTQHEAESGISSFLAGFPYQDSESVDDGLLHQYLEQMQQNLGITYDEDQIRAIEQFFTSPFVILTGGPGTGKTTVVRAMVDLYRMLYPGSTIVCAAPTGRAAKRLSELTETETFTVHSLLRWDLETNTFGKNEEDPVMTDLLIVDEFSMVDDWLFYNLLKASRHVRKICIIGDEDQLPSVSPGCVLRDLIAADMFPLVRLNHIYRQKEGSDVISLAHDIHNGDVDFSRYHNDVVFLENRTGTLRDQVLTIVQSALDKGYEMNDVQVIAPMYNGKAGIDVLNNALQECFNGPSRHKRELKHGYLTFREGDKILQLKNQPDDDVYNGDIGILEAIEYAAETETRKPVIVVNFDGIYVEYTPETFNNITLAYCISIHKSQGSEYPIVVMPVTWQHSIMLQRNLIYTGVTRARQSLVLLGEAGAFLKGVETLERHRRNTTLKEKIIAAFSDPFAM
ncbi:MAG: ATP-dependent RecD-like DNA helicase [Solobacterium sp.]|nr:ATP-dependent RecD-like DNA helicase [Solobacterium sp.]